MKTHNTQALKVGVDLTSKSDTSYTTTLKDTYPHIHDSFVKIQQEQYELFSKKCLDYGIDNIAVGTSLSTREEVKLSITGLWFRMQDKMARLKNLALLSHKNLVGESLKDTLQDVSIYAVIAQLVERGDWKK